MPLKIQEKRVENAAHHCILTNLRKEKTFLNEKYRKNIKAITVVVTKILPPDGKVLAQFWFSFCIVLGQVMPANYPDSYALGKILSHNRIVFFLNTPLKTDAQFGLCENASNVSNSPSPRLHCSRSNQWK